MRVGFLVGAWASLSIFAAIVGCGGSGSSSSGTTSGAGGSTSATTSSSTNAGGSSTASSSTGGEGGFGGAAQGGNCGKCVKDNGVFAAGTACQQAYVDCSKDSVCNDFLGCFDTCLGQPMQTMECIAACEQAASVVTNLYQPFLDCICNSCNAECTVICP